MRSIHIVLLAVLILTGCQSVPDYSKEHVFLPNQESLKWKIVKYENRKDGGVRYFFVPQDETQPRSEFRWTGPSWTTLLSVAYVPGVTGSIRDYAVINSQYNAIVCPGTKYDLLEHDQHDAYVLIDYLCNGQHQSEITRFMRGNEGIYGLSIHANGREFTNTEKDKWRTFLRNSYVAKGHQHERVR